MILRVMGILNKQGKAHGAVHSALLKGKLKRPDKCSSCNKKCKPLAHHPDYNEKLSIIWLCTKCHIEIHAESAMEDRIRRRNILKSSLQNEKIVA